MPDDVEIGRTDEPNGRTVVLTERAWLKITLGHPEMEPCQGQMLAAVRHPDHWEPDPKPGRERFFRRGFGPSAWIKVVVAFDGQDVGRIVTGWATDRDPRTQAMSVTIAEIEFDHVVYDAEGDVLYLSVGEPQPAMRVRDAEHVVVRYDADDRIIGLTILNAKWLVERHAPLELGDDDPVDSDVLVPALA